MKKRFANKKLISVLITSTILFSLFMSGPAHAFFLNFTIPDTDLVQGQMLDMQIKVEIKEGELLNIQKVSLNLDGPQSVSCEFFPNATLINCPSNFQITQVESSEYLYGYGYGYGYGHGYGYSEQGFLPGSLKYDITINSQNLSPGAYTTQYILTTPYQEIESSQKELILRAPDAVQSCSVRASGGTAEITQNTYTKRNRLSLYVPSSKASTGRGFFTAQNSNRISYQYTVHNAQQIGANIIKFSVSGEVRKHSQAWHESAIITLDKEKSTISIKGDKIDIKDMKVNLLEC